LKKFVAIIILLVMANPVLGEDLSEKIEKPVKEAVEIRQMTQKEEDRWAEEKAKMQAEYKELERERKNLLAVNKRLKQEIDVHREEIGSIEGKIKEIERISEELLPCLCETLKRLEECAASSLPFLLEEREQRLKGLRRTLEDSKISASEKFRRIMEALSVEAEYGNTVEVYQKRIDVEGKNILVNIFRLGRLSLFFQTLDQETTGFYNPARTAWVQFPRHCNREISKAIEIAGKMRSIDLLTLPLGRVVVQ